MLLWILISFCIGLLLGGLVIKFKIQHQCLMLKGEVCLQTNQIQELQSRHSNTVDNLNSKHTELIDVLQELAVLKEKLNQQQHWRNECECLSGELKSLQQKYQISEIQLKEITTQLAAQKLSAAEKQQLLQDSERRLCLQFENLANRIFERNGKQVDSLNKSSISTLLSPLRDQLEKFHQQVQESFGQESRERHVLKHEINNLQKLNIQMAQEAVNLTRALKGENKIQGNWGELVLNRLLESSGLRQGKEYDTQVTISSPNQGRIQPDVIVHLPQGREVIIDAKVSLLAYERYFNSEEEDICNQALKDHIASIRNHIRLLSGKNYQSFVEGCSPDYVLLFIPIEPAFITAIDREPHLVNEALQHRIMLVSPTTLLVALRTIDNLWHYEYQSQNAKKIADRAAKLYDKVRLFTDDMLVIGQSLDKAQSSYRQAVNKLFQGRGNLVGQVESFRELGVVVKKNINTILKEAGSNGSENVVQEIGSSLKRENAKYVD